MTSIELIIILYNNFKTKQIVCQSHDIDVFQMYYGVPPPAPLTVQTHCYASLVSIIFAVVVALSLLLLAPFRMLWGIRSIAHAGFAAILYI